MKSYLGVGRRSFVNRTLRITGHGCVQAAFRFLKYGPAACPRMVSEGNRTSPSGTNCQREFEQL
jgi:hypothetical protein